MEKVYIEEVEFTVFRLVEQYAEWNEPIPAFYERNPGLLESCLEQPFQAVFGQELYPELLGKAAILFYLMIKNHPFKNGNKRLAIFTLNLFLNKNLFYLAMEPMDLYNLAIEVASSRAEDKDAYTEKVREKLSKSLIEVRRLP
jgi:death on curing protein